MAANRIDQHHSDEDRVDPSAQIPEADLLEQHTPLDSPLSGDQHNGSTARADDAASAALVDEGDWCEQHLPVSSAGDEEYPPDRYEAR